MRALVKTQKGPGNVALQEVADPTPQPREVLVSVKRAGICGTDLHILEDRFHNHPPFIMGHEFAGEIVALGDWVDNYRLGDRVVAEPHRGGCGRCRYCLTGQVEICRNKRAMGYKVDGCFAPLVNIPATSLHRIPENVTYDQAALSEPLAVVVKAVLERARVMPEDFVVVTGCGPIGLLAAAAAKAGGARAVMITGTDGDEALRLPCARAMGIDYTLNVQRQDAAAEVLELTDGVGADLVVEASGAAPAIVQALDLLKIDGRLAGVGLTGRESIELPWDRAMHKAARIVCSFSSNWTSWERALSLMGTGRIKVDPVISDTVPLERWEEAFDRLKRLEAIKILLAP